MCAVSSDPRTVGRTQWDTISELVKKKWVLIIALATFGAAIVLLLVFLILGQLNCSIVDGRISCSRTSSILTERHNAIVISDTAAGECMEVVAIPPFLSSVINTGGITDIAYQLAFADIFSVSLSTVYQAIFVVDMHPDVGDRKEREGLIKSLSKSKLLAASLASLQKIKDVEEGKKGVILGHIYAFNVERREIGIPSMVFVTMRMVGMDGNEVWQAGLLRSIESVSAVVSANRGTGGVGGFEGVFVMAQEFAQDLKATTQCD